jgi:hypothetical protein
MTAFLESWSLQQRHDIKISPQLKSSFHCHIYSLCSKVTAQLNKELRFKIVMKWRSNIFISIVQGALSRNNRSQPPFGKTTKHWCQDVKWRLTLSSSSLACTRASSTFGSGRPESRGSRNGSKGTGSESRSCARNQPSDASSLNWPQWFGT